MDLKTANKKLEQLENDYNYWLNEKEKILPLVRPQASTIKDTVVSGGTRVDRLSKYIELEDEKKINETLDYIFKKKQNLINWIDNELKILNKYGEVEAVIVQLKENMTIIDKNTKEHRFLTWEEIAQRAGYNKDHCRKIYRLYKQKRDVL